MSVNRTKRVVAFVGLAAAVNLLAGSGLLADNPQSYQAIVVRNAFRLKPIPPPAPEPVQTSAPPVNVKFTGITTFGGAKKAYFMIPDTSNPSVPNSFLYPALEEGQSGNGIELVKINEQDYSVKILLGGQPKVLNFKDNGNLSAPVAIAAGGPPGAPGMPGAPGGPGVPRVVPLQNPNLPGGAPIQPIMNLPGGSGFQSPQGGGNVTSPLQNIPQRPLRTAQANPAENQASLVQSMLNLEITREVNKAQIIAGDHPPLPPTDLSDPGPPTPGASTVPVPGLIRR